MKIQNSIFLFLTTYLICLIVATLFKVKVLLVTSNSMKPEFEFGDVLLVKNQEQYSLQDIVSYRIKDIVVTHRLVAIHSNSELMFETKGDANKSADSVLINNTQILGKLFLVIPKIGYLVLFLQSKYTSILLIVLTSFVFSKFLLNSILRFSKESYES